MQPTLDQLSNDILDLEHEMPKLFYYYQDVPIVPTQDGNIRYVDVNVPDSMRKILKENRYVTFCTASLHDLKSICSTASPLVGKNDTSIRITYMYSGNTEKNVSLRITFITFQKRTYDHA